METAVFSLGNLIMDLKKQNTNISIVEHFLSKSDPGALSSGPKIK